MSRFPFFRILLACLSSVMVTIPALADWTQTNGPEGGLINCIIGSGPDILIGTSGSGVFRSLNFGQSWFPASLGLTNQSAYCFTRLDTNLFVGTDHGVFRSSDNGLLWVEANKVNLTPFCRQGEKPVSSIEGGLVWNQRSNGKDTTDSSRSML